MTEKASVPGVRLRETDHRWLMQNRGSGSVAAKIHELIEYYCYHEGETPPGGIKI